MIQRLWTTQPLWTMRRRLLWRGTQIEGTQIEGTQVEGTQVEELSLTARTPQAAQTFRPRQGVKR